jgi:hypothetical protein
MAKQRSPNCPQITFMEAAAKARSVYSKEHTHPTDKNVIAEDLGYTSISGSSLSAIGALRQYGLLEPSGEGLKVTETAVDYFELPDGSDAKKRAMLKMAFRPALFNELWRQYEGKPPSEGSLRHTLIKKGFLPKTAEEVLRVYEENFKLVGEEALGYNDEQDESMPPPQKAPRTSSTRSAPPDTSPAIAPAGSANISTPVGKDDEGRAVFAHVRFDSALRREFVTGLKKYLDYLEGTLQ